MSYDYKKIKLKDGSTRDEHRLIMEKIIGRKLDFNEVVHHKDENKRNNDPDNLEIKSRSNHSKEHFKPIILSEEKAAIKSDKLSKSLQGEKSYCAILTEKEVVYIKQKLKDGARVVDLANEFNVDRRTIGDIKHGRSWKHINN